MGLSRWAWTLPKAFVHALGHGRREIFPPIQLTATEAFCMLSLVLEHVSQSRLFQCCTQFLGEKCKTASVTKRQREFVKMESCQFSLSMGFLPMEQRWVRATRILSRAGVEVTRQAGKPLSFLLQTFTLVPVTREDKGRLIQVLHTHRFKILKSLGSFIHVKWQCYH